MKAILTDLSKGYFPIDIIINQIFTTKSKHEIKIVHMKNLKNFVQYIMCANYNIMLVRNYN